MKFSLSRGRFGFESLEDRTTPTVNASISSGVLYVKGVSDGAVAITQTAAGVFNVTDNGVAVAVTGTGPVKRDVIVQFTGTHDDDVTIDLGGIKAPAGISAFLGDGTNAFSIKNGPATGTSVGGLTNINSGAGNDTFNLGDGISNIVLSGVNLNPGLGTDTANINGTTTTGSVASNWLDNINVNAGATINGSLTTTLAKNVALASGSTIKVNAILSMTSGSTTVTSAATINGGMSVTGYLFSTFNTPNVSLTGGEVKGNFLVSGGLLNFTGFLTVDVAAGAKVGGIMQVIGGGGSDDINVAGTIGTALNAYLGAGSDYLTVTGTLGTVGQKYYSLYVEGGSGDDTVDITAGTFNGGVAAVLGAGDDTLLINSATITKQLAPYLLYLDGGTGTNTFVDSAGTYTIAGPNSATVKITKFTLP